MERSSCLAILSLPVTERNGGEGQQAFRRCTGVVSDAPNLELFG
jgi:hypothetical protein